MEETLLAANIKTFKKGDIIFNEQDSFNGVYIVKSGYAKIFVVDQDGNERILSILDKGEIIGEMAIIGGSTRTASVMAIEPMECFFIPQYAFQRIIDTSPEVSLKIAEILSERLFYTSRQFTKANSLGSQERVIFGIISLAERFGEKHENGIIIKIRLTHSDFASLVGVSRETVTKVLSELKKHELIAVKNKRIIIFNSDTIYELFKSYEVLKHV